MGGWRGLVGDWSRSSQPPEAIGGLEEKLSAAGGKNRSSASSAGPFLKFFKIVIAIFILAKIVILKQ